MQTDFKRLLSSVILMLAISAEPFGVKAEAPMAKNQESKFEVIRLFNEKSEIEAENDLYEMISQQEKEMAEKPEKFEAWVTANQNRKFVVYNKVVDDTTLVRFDSEGISQTFAVKGTTGDYNNWQEVGTVSGNDIINIAYVVYWEVGGKNPENAMAQIQVIENRMRLSESSAEEVLSAKNQYSSWQQAKGRKLKANTEMEKEDLKKVFNYALQYMACQKISMPDNVIYAALFPQGSGTWKVIDGTYYCYK